MASLRLHLILFLLLHVILLLSTPITCDESRGLQALAKNGNADCLADKVANRIVHAIAPPILWRAARTSPIS
ncbi:hypothetical protein RJ639_026293 [Escallonia herrerae]|uniref:Uncharacterized protein n=1 Tax=Escallonia herrerae TaxID=1293975 RepID=A0AA88UXH7_9ASTE|nr:hypothetical protein RJ639_026293 [Escallonia herrerae]